MSPVDRQGGEPTEREWLEGLRYEDKFPDEGDLDEQVTVTLSRREWLVVMASARDDDVRVGGCLDAIQEALDV